MKTITTSGEKISAKIYIKLKADQILNFNSFQDTNVGEVTFESDLNTEKIATESPKLAPVTIDMSGTKTWIDYGNVENLRPKEITVNLLRNGSKLYDSNGNQVCQVVKENEAGEWKYTFSDLLEYDENGNKYTYTVEENEIQPY